MGASLRLLGILALLASLAGVGLVWLERSGGIESSSSTVRYQFVDDAGAVRIVDSLEEVPADKREGVGRIEFDAPAARRETSASDREARFSIGSLFEGLDDPSDESLVVYTTQRCGYSKRLLAELDERGIVYETRDIDFDREAAAELRKLTGREGVPVSVYGDRVRRGYSPRRAREIESAVDGWGIF